MNSSPLVRFRRAIFAGLLTFTLSCGAASAQSAPSGATGSGIDQETGKPIVTTASGLKYVDISPGAGPTVKTGDHIFVTYVGKLIDGTKFDASADHGNGIFDYVQGVTGLIPGWTEGTSTMKAGGERKLIIPPQLGYGQEGAGDAVPPNATLIFDIKVVSIKPS